MAQAESLSEFKSLPVPEQVVISLLLSMLVPVIHPVGSEDSSYSSFGEERQPDTHKEMGTTDIKGERRGGENNVSVIYDKGCVKNLRI